MECRDGLPGEILASQSRDMKRTPGPKCLRCGADSSWIKGRVPDEPNDQVQALRDALRMVKARWTFNNHQMHTHTWHDWADCIVVIDAALKGNK
jgi:hypothetical protein